MWLSEVLVIIIFLLENKIFMMIYLAVTFF